MWDDSLTHEIALALAASAPSAGKTMRAAWELGARLPETAALLQTGIIDAGKARLITEIFQELPDESAGRAEQLLVPELTEPPAKTYPQVERIATAIALMIDPHLGERRRKTAEKHHSRIEMFRERAGTAALTGRDLPTDQTLSAFANVSTRAATYKTA
ncbi:MAG: endonuclease, partial [Actinomycetia bacterium]|nr:endonuclease [Actinomycetes bacterium]